MKVNGKIIYPKVMELNKLKTIFIQETFRKEKNKEKVN
jgi:hypothetical protein